MPQDEKHRPDVGPSPSQTNVASHRRPISFIATDAPDVTGAFYRDVIGLRLVETSPFALVFDDHGHMLRVQIVDKFTPAPFTAHGWQTDNIAAHITSLTAKGAVFETFDHLPQDALGVWTTPDGSQIAWFKDPNGNILSLTQFAPE